MRPSVIFSSVVCMYVKARVAHLFLLLVYIIKDFDHFCGVLEAIEENSPDARIFVLVHKMDLVAVEDRETILEERKRLISESCMSCGVENFQCFGTSIWDETLYKAWSEIVTNLIPNIALLETHLNNFCRICDADEVVLFERATFLVISHAQASDTPSAEEETTDGTMTTHVKRTQHFDPHRFEKISNVRFDGLVYEGWWY